MKYTAPQRRLLEDQGTQFKFSTHAMGRTGLSKGPGKRFQGVTLKDKKQGVEPGEKKVIPTKTKKEKGKKIESEDFHGGDLQSGGQFPTDALERSQARKGTPDLFKHPDDPGQAGKK